MAKLSGVPGWVRPPLRAVADVEHYLLRLFGSTESPEALAGYSSLTWLGGADGVATLGPLPWRAAPTAEIANAFVTVANALADGEPYPSGSWWQREAPILGPMSRVQWAEHSVPVSRRYYAHGVVCALGWVSGLFDDPAILAPIHRGTGNAVSYSEREEYRVRLRGFAIPPGLPRGHLRTWLTDGPAGLGRDAAPAQVVGGHGRAAGA